MPSALSEPVPLSGTGEASEPYRQRRKHREAEIKYAYALQRDAAIQGAGLWTLLGGTGVFFSHHLFPRFRSQTLAFKAFLTSGFTIFGLVVGADSVLLSHEGKQRSEEEMIRKRARIELGRKGVIPSEKEIEKWKVETRERGLRRREREREGRAEEQEGDSSSHKENASLDTRDIVKLGKRAEGAAGQVAGEGKDKAERALGGIAEAASAALGKQPPAGAD